MPVIILLIAICTLGLTSSLDPDFGWHLYLSKQLHKTGQLTQKLTGYWSYPNTKLIDHQWLTHYLLGQLNIGGYGYTFLVVTFGLIAVIIYGSVYYSLMRQGYSRSISIFITTLLILPLPIVFGVRVQVLLLLGASALIYVAPLIKKIGWRRLFYLFIFTIGTNMHGGYLLLVTIPLALEAYPVASAWKSGLRGAKLKPFIIDYLLTMGCVAIGLLSSPYGFSYWKLVISYVSDGYYKTHIIEWFPVYSIPSAFTVTIVTFAISIFLLTFKIRKRSATDPFYIILLIIWAYLGIRYIRFYPVLLLIAGPILADSCKILISESSLATLPSTKKLLFLFWVIIAAIITAQSSGDFNLHFMGWPLNPKLAYGYPDNALSYIETNYNQQCQGHLLNPYVWGGYVLGFSNQEVFIDGRGPQLKLPNNLTLLQEYGSTNDKAKLPGMVKEFDIHCVLAEIPQNNNSSKLVDKIFNRPSNSNLNNGNEVWIEYFGNQSNWEAVYSDSFARVYVLINPS